MYIIYHYCDSLSEVWITTRTVSRARSLGNTARTPRALDLWRHHWVALITNNLGGDPTLNDCNFLCYYIRKNNVCIPGIHYRHSMHKLHIVFAIFVHRMISLETILFSKFTLYDKKVTLNFDNFYVLGNLCTKIVFAIFVHRIICLKSTLLVSFSQSEKMPSEKSFAYMYTLVYKALLIHML